VCLVIVRADFGPSAESNACIFRVTISCYVLKISAIELLNRETEILTFSVLKFREGGEVKSPKFETDIIMHVDYHNQVRRDNNNIPCTS